VASTSSLSLAIRARYAIYNRVMDAVPDSLLMSVSLDAGEFHPNPLGVLIGLPSLISRGLGHATFAITCHVVSGAPINADDRLTAWYELADIVAVAIDAAEYAPTDWSGGVNRDPLPSIAIPTIVSIEGGS
jgi:hypothetical protein